MKIIQEILSIFDYPVPSGFVFSVPVSPEFNSKVSIGHLSNLAHGVGGEVFVVNAKTLWIKNFRYDGAGPDTFFWVGTVGTPASTDKSKTAILAHPFRVTHYKYRNQAAPILGRANGEDVTLTMPPNMKVSRNIKMEVSHNVKIKIVVRVTLQ